MEPKQVIVWRKDLNVRKGKLAAQIAHSSMKVFLDNSMKYEKFDEDGGIKVIEINFRPNSAWDKWLNGIFTKIVVSCENEEELDRLYQQAKDANLPCAMIVDAGLTEFHGVPTKTCIAIGPAYPDKIDKITGNLKLL